MFCYQSRTVQSHGLFFSWLKPAADTKRLSSAVYRRTESVTGWIFTANVAKSRVTHAPLSYSTSRFKRRLVRCLIRSRKPGIAERLCNSVGARVCREALGCELQVGEGDGTRRREETTTDVSSVGPLCSADGRPTHETLYVGFFFLCSLFSSCLMPADHWFPVDSPVSAPEFVCAEKSRYLNRRWTLSLAWKSGCLNWWPLPEREAIAFAERVILNAHIVFGFFVL